MGEVFVIADLHFGHRKLAEVRGFTLVETHDAAICDAWKRVVTKRDVVYVLGDVFDESLLSTLPGTKKLAMGNHDLRPMPRYLPHFSQIRSCFEFDGCLLSHIPVHSSQFPRYEMNVHGHTHTGCVTVRCGGEICADHRYVPVSVEHCPGMAPMRLRDVIQARRQILKEVGRG